MIEEFFGKDSMRLKEIIHEDYVNYKKPSLFLGTCFCSFKCCREQGVDCSICQNQSFMNYPVKEVEDEKIVDMFLSNPLTKAVVIGGLEPFDQWKELKSFVECFRKRTDADVVIYTGFYRSEIEQRVKELKTFPNIILKFGRFKLNGKKHFDEVLGVELANQEQYGEKIS